MEFRGKEGAMRGSRYSWVSKRTTRLENQKEKEVQGTMWGREGVSCAESIIFISRGSTGLPCPVPFIFSCPFPQSREPSRAKPSVASLPLSREYPAERIDRFEMRELCAAVIPWCDDLSVAPIFIRSCDFISHIRAVFEDVPRLIAAYNSSLF